MLQNKYNKPLKKTEYDKFLEGIYISQDICMRHDQFVVPKSMRMQIVEAAHSGHPGKNTMVRTIARFLWWPELKKDVDNFVKCCISCTRMRRPENPEPITSSTMPSEPWMNIAIDFFSAPLDLKSKILVIKDYYSRYLVVKLVNSENTREVVNALNSVFNIFGNPKSIKADNGPPFQSSEFSEWCENRNIKLLHSSPLSPRQNGLVERAMQGIKRALTAAKMENRNMTEALNEYVHAYNRWPHTVTLLPPSDMMFARAVRGNFPSSDQAEIITATQDEIFERDRISKFKSKLYQDRIMNAKLSTININDLVYILKKGETKLSPRFGDKRLKVIAKNGSQLKLETDTGEVILRTVDHVTKIVTNTDIENYRLEMERTKKKSQKGYYEENKPILIKFDSGKHFIAI